MVKILNTKIIPLFFICLLGAGCTTSKIETQATSTQTSFFAKKSACAQHLTSVNASIEKENNSDIYTHQWLDKICYSAELDTCLSFVEKNHNDVDNPSQIIGQEYTITNLFTNERLQDIAWFGSDDPGKKEYNYNKIGAGTKYRCVD